MEYYFFIPFCAPFLVFLWGAGVGPLQDLSKGIYAEVLSASRDNIKCAPSQIPFTDDTRAHQIEVVLGDFF